MITCKDFPDREFSDKKELFKALRESEKDLIKFKKKQVYKSRDKGASVKVRPIDFAKLSESIKAPFSDSNFYYIAVNTTKILDSHMDLHVNGIWNRTAKNQSGKNSLVDTHELSIRSTIAHEEDIEIFVQEIPFSMIGSSLKGSTEALIYKVPKDKIIDPKAKQWLEQGYRIEASVRMQYVQIELAMDSESPEDEYYKNNFDQYIDQIANKEQYEETYGDISFFWVVKEAKNVDESSLVLRGSNPETGQITDDSQQSTQPTKKALDAQSRLEEKRKYFINQI